MLQFFGNSKSQRASKLHYWFKSYGDFAEQVDFAYWLSFSGGWCAINGATMSSSDRLLAKNQLFYDWFKRMYLLLFYLLFQNKNAY